MRVKLSKSIRKHLRSEKNKIHRQALNSEEEKKMINEVYEKLGIKKQFSHLKKSEWPKDEPKK
jgi:hypothetical protein